MKRSRAIAVFVLLVMMVSCKQPQPLIYKGVRNFSLQRASLSHPAVGMDIAFYNPNNYNLKLKRAEVDVYINNNHLGDMTLDTFYLIPAKDSFFIPVVLNVDAGNIFPNAAQLLLHKEADIRLEGFIKAGRRGPLLNMPIHYETKQPLNINF